MALDFVAVNAPPQHPEKDRVMEKLFGNGKVPAMWDTRTGELLQGEERIGEYLEGEYGQPAHAKAA